MWFQILPTSYSKIWAKMLRCFLASTVTLISVRPGFPWPNASSWAYFKYFNTFCKMVFSTYKLNHDVNNQRYEESQTVLKQNFTQAGWAACPVEFKLLRFSSRHCESFKMLISFNIQKKQLRWSLSCLVLGTRNVENHFGGRCLPVSTFVLYK